MVADVCTCAEDVICGNCMTGGTVPEPPKPAHVHGPFVGTPFGPACRGCGLREDHCV